MISRNCLGHRGFRKNTRRNSTLFSLSLSTFPILPRKHRCFSPISFSSYSRVAMPWRERERVSVCVWGFVLCCYQLCSLLGWLDMFSTVLLQVLLFMITLGPNQESTPLSLSLSLSLSRLYYCFSFSLTYDFKSNWEESGHAVFRPELQCLILSVHDLLKSGYILLSILMA